MILFFRNIPTNTRPTELLPHVTPELIGKYAQVVKVEILVIRDKKTNELEHHGLVFIDPKITDQSDEVLFNNAQAWINNKLVYIRKFNQRSLLNDRRNNHAFPPSQIIIDRRLQERRRGSRVEKIIDLANQFTEVQDSFE